MAWDDLEAEVREEFASLNSQTAWPDELLPDWQQVMSAVFTDKQDPIIEPPQLRSLPEGAESTTRQMSQQLTKEAKYRALIAKALEASKR